MTRRREYFYTVAILLVTLFGSYTVWHYSMPDHYPSPPSLFTIESAMAQTDSSTSASQMLVVPVIVQPQSPSVLVVPVVEPAAVASEPGEPVSVPILMYHKINDFSGGLYTISPDEFDWQMQYLKENGYHTVSIASVLDHFEKGKPLPEKPVVITLDDGFRDNYLNAYPILKKYGFTATIFVTTNTVAPEEITNMMLTWSQIKEMAADGITMGCHTLNHSDLTSVSLGEAKRQITDSKEILEDQLGIKIDVFAYPYGCHNYNVEKLVEECGFRAAVTVNPEPVSSVENPFTLNRIGIYSNLSRSGFITKVSV